MKTSVDNSAKVDEYLQTLDHPFKAEMAAVRQIILNANSNVLERIKWNAPSFYYIKDIAAFNPRATDYLQLILVFPNGIVEDPAGLMQGDWLDRREARFHDMEDVQAKQAGLEQIVNDWVTLMDKNK